MIYNYVIHINSVVFSENLVKQGYSKFEWLINRVCKCVIEMDYGMSVSN